MTENEIKFASNYIANIALEDNGAEKVNIAIQSLLLQPYVNNMFVLTS